jgi:hypothetical protein
MARNSVLMFFVKLVAKFSRYEGPAMSNEVRATFPWQESYFNAILVTDSSLVMNRIYDALSAIEQRWLSPVTDQAEYLALVAAYAGIKSLIAERTEGSNPLSPKEQSVTNG